MIRPTCAGVMWMALSYMFRNRYIALVLSHCRHGNIAPLIDFIDQIAFQKAPINLQSHGVNFASSD
jgi:hypothetical protein